MNRSLKEAAAIIRRGESNVSSLPTDYRLLSPALPTGNAAKFSAIPHAGLQGGPYRIEDFREQLDRVGVSPGVADLGAYQITHVWLLTLHSPEAKSKLLEAGSLQVKGHFCQLVDSG